MSNLLVTIHATVLARLHGWHALRTRSSDRGQATAEYALVVVGAAAVAFIFISWAASGGGQARVGHLLDAVIDRVASVVS